MFYSKKALQAGNRFAKAVIHHTAFSEALTHICNSVQLGNDAGIFAGVRITAPSGCGKSLLISQVDEILKQQYPTLASKPLIYASLKESPNVAQIQNDLLANFNYGINPRASANNSEVRHVLVSAIERHQVKIVALDEFQHVFLSSGDKASTIVIDWLKRLMNLTGVPVILAGTEAMNGLAKIDPQLTTRIPTTVQLTPFTLNRQWAGVLKALAEFSKDVNLAPIHEVFGKKLFDATQGLPRALMALLVQAIVIAVDSDQVVMTEPILRKAYSLQYGPTSDGGNVFAVS